MRPKHSKQANITTRT